MLLVFSGTYGFKSINTLWSIILCENCSSTATRQVQPRHSPLHATWKYHVIVESLPWNPRWLHYHMGFTQQRWVSAKYNLPTSIILLWILFGIVTRSKYYMASHKLQLKQININFLFPKFVLRVFFPHTSTFFYICLDLAMHLHKNPRPK